MRWRRPGHHALAEAIVSSFRAPSAQTERLLRTFSPTEWQKTWFWLDASGLALYFLRHAKEAAFLNAVDPATQQHLREDHHNNTTRNDALFREFAALNRAFLRQRILFANLKGFTLYPNACPDPTLRLQLDLDFLVAARHLGLCRAILESRGYELTAATATTWEFKANHYVSVEPHDIYQPSPDRSVELHFMPVDGSGASSAHDDRLDRVSVWHHNGCSVPALSPADQLISQALHIFSHLRSSSTRPAWLLEFKQQVHTYYHDAGVWRDIRTHAHDKPLIPIALGSAILLATDLFGEFTPPLLRDWAEPSVPSGVRMWLARYGRRAVLADFPGTKLYLLLEHELAGVAPDEVRCKPAGLVPRLRFPSPFRNRPDAPLSLRMLRFWMQVRFLLFRGRFHVVEGLRYIVESTRWRFRPHEPTRLET